MQTFIKQPNKTLDYDFDFSQWMPADDSLPDSLGASTVTVSPGLTAGEKLHPSGNIVKQWISSRTNSASYKVTCTITTTQCRTKETEIRIRVRDQ